MFQAQFSRTNLNNIKVKNKDESNFFRGKILKGLLCATHSN